MIKTHLISCSDGSTFQKSINEFIKDRDIIDIKFQSVVYPTETNGHTVSGTAVNDRALIIYKE